MYNSNVKKKPAAYSVILRVSFVFFSLFDFRSKEKKKEGICWGEKSVCPVNVACEKVKGS